MRNNYSTLPGIILMTVFFFSPIYSICQEKPSEYQIIHSGEYYWGLAYSRDSLQAKNDARDVLMSKISEEINNSVNLTSKSDIMVKCIRYFFKPVGGINKYIAYVSIVDVQNIIENKSSLGVIQIQYTEENTKKDIITDVQKSFPIEEKVDTGQKNNSIVEKTNTSVGGQTLINQLIACNNAAELKVLLQKEAKYNGLIFNWGSKNYQSKVSSEPFYIALINPDDDNIIAFLDKGKTDRKDLKNPPRTMNISRESNNYIQVWIKLP